MDVVQKVRDLSNLALDGGGDTNERFNAAIAALRLIKECELLGNRRVNIADDILQRIVSPDFAEGVAARAEKIADSVDRVIGSVRRVSDRLSREGGGGAKRARRYRGR